MKAAVLLNSSAGAASATKDESVEDRVREAFRRSALNAQVQSVSRTGLEAAAREAAASDADIVVLGGGDGTVGAGAAALLHNPRSLGVIPLGTLNHFAKDLGIPLDLDGAVSVIGAGHVREVDVGEVNGHVFLNNSSIGLYPLAVDQREELRRHGGGGKMAAMFNACLDALRRFPLLDVSVRSDDGSEAFKTPFVFVSNNRYEMNLFSLGKRVSLQDGELGLYLTEATSRKGVIRLAARALVGRMKQDRDFRYFTTSQAEIHTKRALLRVATDGEVKQMSSPIRYRTRPRALRVLAPAPVAEADEH